jgi:hypothetical protein
MAPPPRAMRDAAFPDWSRPVIHLEMNGHD